MSLRSCAGALIWLLSRATVAGADVSACPVARSPTIPIHTTRATIRLPLDIALIYRPINAPKLVIEARFDEGGRLECANPLSGPSLYWPTAVNSLTTSRRSRRTPEGTHEIITFNDPGQADVRQAWELAGSGQVCNASLGIEAVLRLGAGHIQRDRPEEAAACFDVALSVASNSVAAHFGAAMAAGMLGDTESRIEHYQHAASLSPRFYEARLSLAAAQHFANQPKASEETLTGILVDSPPLPTRRRVYDVLVSVYDQTKNRPAAAKAKQSLVVTESEIRHLDSTLVNEAVIAFDTKNLAAREEEIGNYQLSAKHFAEALHISGASTVSEAVRFEAAMGWIRSNQKLGEAEAALKACADWKGRLAKLAGEFDNLHWGGRAIAEAQWQFSCGDSGKAFLLMQEDIKRRPTSDIPYLTIERFYRARGQSDLGDKVHALADRLRTEHDSAVLGAILDEAVDLAKQGGVQRFP